MQCSNQLSNNDNQNGSVVWLVSTNTCSCRSKWLGSNSKSYAQWRQLMRGTAQCLRALRRTLRGIDSQTTCGLETDIWLTCR